MRRRMKDDEAEREKEDEEGREVMDDGTMRGKTRKRRR